MKTNFCDTVENYISPETNVIYIMTETVICATSNEILDTDSIDPWIEGNTDWF